MAVSVAARYVRGDWTALVTAYGTALLHPSIDEEHVRGVWAALSEQTGVSGCLEVLAADGLASLPSFALVQHGDGELRVLVRGEVTVTAGEHTVGAAGIATWREALIPARSYRIAVSDDGGAHPDWPIAAGVVLASQVSWQDDAAAASGAEAGAVEVGVDNASTTAHGAAAPTAQDPEPAEVAEQPAAVDEVDPGAGEADEPDPGAGEADEPDPGAGEADEPDPDAGDADETPAGVAAAGGADAGAAAADAGDGADGDSDTDADEADANADANGDDDAGDSVEPDETGAFAAPVGAVEAAEDGVAAGAAAEEAEAVVDDGARPADHDAYDQDASDQDASDQEGLDHATSDQAGADPAVADPTPAVQSVPAPDPAVAAASRAPSLNSDGGQLIDSLPWAVTAADRQEAAAEAEAQNAAAEEPTGALPGGVAASGEPAGLQPEELNAPADDLPEHTVLSPRGPNAAAQTAAVDAGAPVPPWQPPVDMAQPSGPVPPYGQGNAEIDGDHDGQTIMASELPKHQDMTIVPGLGDTDLYDEPGQPPEGGPVLSLSVSTGAEVPLDRPVLIGRAPESSRFSAGVQPRLVTVPSPEQDISRTHVEVRAEGSSAVVTDLNSTNGTVVMQPGAPPRRLHAGEGASVPAGTLIDLGDDVKVSVHLHDQGAG